MTDDTNDTHDDLSDPENYNLPAQWPEWWLPPAGHGTDELRIRFNDPEQTTDEVLDTLKEGHETGAKQLGVSDRSVIREFASLMDAHTGYLLSPPEDAEDQHPLDALHVLRAVRDCVNNLTHNPYVKCDSVVLDALSAAERDIRAAEVKYERTCDEVGLPTDGELGGEGDAE